MEQKTDSRRAKKKRAKLESDIKTAKAALDQATQASLEATSSEGGKERHKAEAEKIRKEIEELE